MGLLDYSITPYVGGLLGMIPGLARQGMEKPPAASDFANTWNSHMNALGNLIGSPNDAGKAFAGMFPPGGVVASIPAGGNEPGVVRPRPPRPGFIETEPPASPAPRPALPAGFGPGTPAAYMPSPIMASPSPAALPPGAAPIAPSAPEPSFMDRAGNALDNNSNMLMLLGAGIAGGRNWGEGISQGLQGAAQGRKLDQSLRNQTVTMKAMYDSLLARGIAPAQAAGIAHAASIDPKIAEKLLPQALGLNPPTTIEASLAAEIHDAKLAGRAPDFASAMRRFEEFTTKKSAATKTGEVIGDRGANAELDLPSLVASAQEQLRLTEEMRKHPGRDNSLFFHGLLSGVTPDILAPGGSDARGALALLSQIKGGSFLTAFEKLKGAGAITEVEGKKATDAINRMERATSREEFDRALSDYQGVIRLGIDRANQLAGRNAPFGFKGNTAPAWGGPPPPSGFKVI